MCVLHLKVYFQISLEGAYDDFPTPLPILIHFFLTVFIKAIFSKICNSLITSETEYADDFVYLLL